MKSLKPKSVIKIRSVIVVLAFTAVFTTTGTFAWTSISQRALNEGAVVRQPGARVHDDYEGFGTIISQNGGPVNKDIFVENYSNKPVYARIKLTEYLETGLGAGQYELVGEDNQMQPTTDNQALVLASAGLDQTTLEDRSTWPAYLPDGELTNGGKSSIRDYITWSLGDRNDSRKVYMPTFNQNNLSLESDVTGEGIEELTWSKNGNYDTAQNPLPGTHDQWTLGEKHRSTLRSYDEASQKEVLTEAVEHVAVTTLAPENQGYLTMSEWEKLGQPSGDFWLHDRDGWFYWANPIPAYSATSLLLDRLEVTFPLEDMYYAINVVSDFATSDDLNMWTGVSNGAASLLDKIK